jgi:hypothetical protein
MTSTKAQAGSFSSFKDGTEPCSVESFCLNRYLSDFGDRPVQERLLESSLKDPQSILIEDLEGFMSLQCPPDFETLKAKGPFEQ